MMKVFSPEITEKGGDICVTARVETESCPTPLPDTLWFRFPQKYAKYVTGDANGFATALLPLAMILGEDMYIEGALSPRLLRGLEEYQRIQCAWNPSPFRPINIIPGPLRPSSADACEGGVGSSFSGGVDSAYTLWRHLAENEESRPYRISHCLMINGFEFDVDLEESGYFSTSVHAIQPMMDRIDVQFIVCNTNYMAFSDSRIILQSFNAMVISPALILGGLFSAFYIPSSYRFNDFFRNGSHLMLDHLLATETMETIHEGSHLKRTEKTRIISDWSETYSTLRVCALRTGYDQETGAVQNCCRCEKCIRTMMTLELFGGLQNYKVFPRKVRKHHIWLCNYWYKGVRLFAQEIISDAFRARRFGIMIDFCVAILVSSLVTLPIAGIRQLHLFIEKRSTAYEKFLRRIYPGLRTRPRFIE